MVLREQNRPPVYNYDASPEDNFKKFFDWGLSLKDPFKQIPEIGQELGFGIRKHPIGMVAVYLSAPSRGIYTPEITGIARADIYSPDEPVNDHKHTHGFSSTGGNVDGDFTNTLHFPEKADKGTYIEYRTTVDKEGRNHTHRVSDAPTVIVPRSEAHHLKPGEVYHLRPDEYHSVSAGRAVTVFIKTPAKMGKEGESSILLKPGDTPPPAVY